MVDGAKCNSHDRSSHFKKSILKNDYWKKKIIYLCNCIEVASKIDIKQSLHRYTLQSSSGIKISTFLRTKSGGEAEVIQYPFRLNYKNRGCSFELNL